MTEPAPEVPPYVRPYLPDFRDLWRQLDLVPGFIFQPVVLPSPDLARALADWLAAQGVAVRVFDMRSEPWDDLAVRLRTLTFDPPAERRAVVVITPSHLDRAGIADGLAAVNFSRDSIAEHLSCPLLWCGDIELLRTTAELATDLWSIAATVYRIPIRALSDLPSGSMRVGWTGAVRESLETIAARLEHSRQKEDSRAVIEGSLDLGEAQVAHGDRNEASRTLSAVKSLVSADHAMALRWHILADAVHSETARPVDTIVGLRARIASAHARGAVAAEASLHQELAQVFARNHRAREATEALLAARTLHLRAGDEAAVVDVEALLTTFAAHLSPDVIAEIRAHAEDMTRSSSPPRVRASAWRALAEIAYHQQRWDEADAAASTMLRLLPPDALNHISALILRLKIAYSRGDLERELVINTELLDYALAHNALPVAESTYASRAICYFRLDRFEAACRDIRSARALNERLGDRPAEAVNISVLAASARSLGALEIYAALLPRAFEVQIREQSPLLRDAADLWILGDLQHVDIVQACADNPAGRERTIAQFGALADARERALRDRGIDPYDVDTWPTDAAALDMNNGQ